MTFKPLTTLIVLAVLIGCTPEADLDGIISEEARAAPYPRIVDITGRLPEATDLDPIEVIDQLEARRSALERRTPSP